MTGSTPNIFFRALVALVGADNVHNHASDIYVKQSPDVRALCDLHGVEFTGYFREGVPWLDIPFQYEPFWQQDLINDKRDVDWFVREMGLLADGLTPGIKPGDPGYVTRATGSEWVRQIAEKMKRDLSSTAHPQTEIGG